MSVIEINEELLNAVAQAIATRPEIAQREEGIKSLLEQLFDNQIRLEARIRQLEGDGTVQVTAAANVDLNQGTLTLMHTRKLPESLRVPAGAWKDRRVIHER